MSLRLGVALKPISTEKEGTKWKMEDLVPQTRWRILFVLLKGYGAPKNTHAGGDVEEARANPCNFTYKLCDDFCTF